MNCLERFPWGPVSEDAGTGKRRFLRVFFLVSIVSCVLCAAFIEGCTTAARSKQCHLVGPVGAFQSLELCSDGGQVTYDECRRKIALNFELVHAPAPMEEIDTRCQDLVRQLGTRDQGTGPVNQ